jgi:hypothetical protein
MDYRDLIVTPLYAYRGLGILSLQYLIFTILAISAYLEWKKILNSKSWRHKIAMFGPESTGKTTLSIQLADYYKTEWVPEFAAIIWKMGW